jgi:putative copper resistance protein D
MDAAFVIARAVHVGTLMALLGGLVFATWVSGTWRSGKDGSAEEGQRCLVRYSAGYLALTMVSGLAWLGFEAVSMSGLPPAEALGHRTLATVLTETAFGQVWLVRGGLSLVMASLLVAGHRPLPIARRSLLLLCTVVAATLLSSLALVGHANSERGMEHAIHLAADTVHLLAGGAWLGGLVPLVAELGRRRESVHRAALADLAGVVQRFSSLGLVCVGALVVTGIVNASFTVGTISGLLATHYGHLLVLKTGLFGAMLALAANNRIRQMPLLANGNMAPSARSVALARLRRNAIGELACGLVILIVAGTLGTTMPASHGPGAPPAMHMH